MPDRGAVLVYAGSADWRGRLAAASAAMGAELVWTASAEEVRARLATARSYSAVLLAESAPGVDRDLLFEAGKAGASPVVVADASSRPGRGAAWTSLGAAHVIESTFSVDELVEVLAVITTRRAPPEGEAMGSHGAVIAVCGAGGTGASTVAAAIAQGFVGRGSRVVLADFARHGEQAMLHDVAGSDGVEALVEVHRQSTPDASVVRALAHPVSDRGYDLLVGLRRARAWSLLRPRAVAAAIESCRSTYDLVVCDIDPDLEGEADGGSLDVEERNVLARTAVGAAAVVVVVAAPGLKGTHSLARVLGDLWAHGGHPARTVIALNRADLSVGTSVVEAALRRLLPGAGEVTPQVVPLPECAIEQAFVTGIPLPSELVVPITDEVARSLEQDTTPPEPPGPVRVAPGSLGSWHHYDDV